MKLGCRCYMLCFITASLIFTRASRGFVSSRTSTVPRIVLTPLLLSAANGQQNSHFAHVSMTSMAATSATESREEHTRDFQQQNDKNNDKLSLGLGDKSWRSLLEVSMARSRGIRGSNYVQLATVDTETNEPRCRTVVFRGFQKFPEDHSYRKLHSCDGLSTVLKMCTNANSKKAVESAAAEVVWWFPKSSEQYRFRGKLRYVGGGSCPLDDDPFLVTARKELWGNLSDAARESFLDEKIPGMPVQQNPEMTIISVPAGGRDPTTGKPVPPPDCFLLVLLLPQHVDYLNLKENYRQMDAAAEEEGVASWSFQQVNA
jgi:pyridoxamine 5'-phosphate oxidase